MTAAAPARAPRLVLAPMAEVSDSPMRRLARSFGADAAVTEMVSAAGLSRGNARTRLLLEHAECERPLAAQLYGGDPAEMEAAARIAAAHGGFDALDLNAGCPVPKVLRSGGGAALMREPGKIGVMVARMRAASGLPVSVKTRVGERPDAVSIFEVMRAAEEAGAAAITVHGRFASAGHGGPAAVDLMAEAVARANIPVVVNGGINCAADALRIARETRAAGLMVGRAAIGRPWIFREIKAAFAAEAQPRAWQSADAAAVFQEHIALVLEFYGSPALREAGAAEPERAALRAFTSHLFRYFTRTPGANAIRRGMCSCRSVADVMRLMGGAGARM